MTDKKHSIDELLSFQGTCTGHTLEQLGVKAQSTDSGISLTVPFPTEALTEVMAFKELVERLPEAIEVISKIPRFAIKAGIQSHPAAKNIICVASGKGGVGKSTVSANLVRALHSLGAKVGLLDADIYGPSVPKIVGRSSEKAEVEEKRLVPVVVDGIPTISIGYLIDEETPMVWRGPMISSALSQLVNETNWPELDYLIIDCPPGTGDIQLTLGQKMPIAGAIIVTTPQEVANIDALKALKMFEKVEVPILGLVENMSYVTCGSCSAKTALFGSGGGQVLADKGQTTLLGTLAFNPKIAQNTDEGQSSLDIEPEYRLIAQRLTQALALRPRDYSLGIKKQIIS